MPASATPSHRMALPDDALSSSAILLFRSPIGSVIRAHYASTYADTQGGDAVSLVDGIHGEVTAMRATLASGLTMVAGAYEHAGRIVEDVNRIGFLGVGRRCLGVQQTITQIRATMALATDQFTDASTCIGTASGQATPQQLIDALTRTQATITAVREALSATIPQVNYAHQEISEALRGAKPGPMCARLEAIRTALADVATQCQATDQHLTQALTQARHAGSLGAVGAVAGDTPAIAVAATDPTEAAQPPKRIQDLGRSLPVRKRRTDPTHGTFNGVEVVSREDLSLVADLRPFRLGGWPTPLLSHVESHVAARMRREGIQDGELVLNNVVCGNRGFDNDLPETCERYLRAILPRDARLTVWATSDGGQTWWTRTYLGTGERIIPPDERISP